MSTARPNAPSARLRPNSGMNAELLSCGRPRRKVPYAIASPTTASPAPAFAPVTTSERSHAPRQTPTTSQSPALYRPGISAVSPPTSEIPSASHASAAPRTIPATASGTTSPVPT